MTRNYSWVMLTRNSHNLRLLHANELEKYLDYTSYMSGALIGYHDEKNFPQMCFNAANHASLGWMDDRLYEAIAEVTQQFRLAPFVDYRETDENYDYVIGQMGSDLFFQWNRAKAHNANVLEYPNEVVLVQQMGSGSEVLSTLQVGEVFENDDWMLAVCGENPAANGHPEHMMIAVAKPGTADVCDESNQPQSCGPQGMVCTDHSQCCALRCRITADPFINRCGAMANPFAIDLYQYRLPMDGPVRGERTENGN